MAFLCFLIGYQGINFGPKDTRFLQNVIVSGQILKLLSKLLNKAKLSVA